MSGPAMYDATALIILGGISSGPGLLSLRFFRMVDISVSATGWRWNWLRDGGKYWVGSMSEEGSLDARDGPTFV